MRVERRRRATGGLGASGAEAKKVLDVRGEQVPPGSVRVVQEDGVDDERQQPLAALHPRLQATIREMQLNRVTSREKTQ